MKVEITSIKVINIFVDQVKVACASVINYIIKNRMLLFILLRKSQKTLIMLIRSRFQSDRNLVQLYSTTTM